MWDKMGFMSVGHSPMYHNLYLCYGTISYQNMVKLQKRFAYEYNDKKHFKHVVTIPEDVIEKLGWKEGTELEGKTDNGKLVFKPIKSRKRGRFYS